jgi:hypothetical protein
MSDAMDEKVDTNDKDTTESISKSICGDITLLSKLKGQQRSQSTIQLLGYINAFEDEEEKDQDEGDTIVQKKNDVNDDIALKKRGYDTLVNTCTSLLSCIQILRRIIREYAYGRMGKELQHLSLTVASFERVLYTFIKEEVLIVSNEFAKRPPIDFRSKNALKDIIPLISKNERHNILIGGTAALLRHATKSLEETKQVLEDLQTGYDPNWEKRWSFSSLMITFISFFLYKKWKNSINLIFNLVFLFVFVLIYGNVFIIVFPI